MCNQKLKENKIKKNVKIEKIDIVIFFTVFIIFIFALLSFFPGILTSDNIDQIEQARNNVYTSGHPIIHSFIIGNLTKLGGTGGIWVPAVFQIIIFSLMWTYLCKRVRKYNSLNKNKLFQVIVTFIIAVIPLNFMYSITMWKDILYSYNFILLLLFIYIGIKEKYNYSNVDIFLICLSCVSIMKFRYNGLPIGFLMFFILMLLNFKNCKKLKTLIKFILFFVFLYVLYTVPSKLVNDVTEPSSGSVVNASKLYCMGALIKEDIDINEEEKEFLNSIMELEEWKKVYNSYSGGTFFYNPKANIGAICTEDGKEKFEKLFNKLAKQKPMTVLKHYLCVNSIWWSIKDYGGMHGIVLSNDWVSEMCKGEYDNHPIIPLGHRILLSYSNKSMGYSFRYEILYRPAVAIIVSCIGIIILSWKKKKISYFMLLLPMLLNIGTYVFLISSQDHRYFYPCHITEYVALIIIGAELIKLKKNTKKEKCKKGKKTLVIVPAYNEEGAINKTVNKIYEENEDCDVIVINDGSKDKTLQEANKTKAIVIDSPNNLGIGGAVQTGYLYAYKNNYDIAIQVDGDGQHDPKYISKMVEILSNEDVDMVIGSRFIENTEYKQTFMRMLGINIISVLIKLFTEEKIYDTTSGFRAVNRAIIKEFVNDYPYDYPEPVTSMQMIFKGMKIKEIPVTMKQRETGVSSISPLKSVSYMIKVILSLILNSFKKYN